jgi:hypothetical protein
MLRRLERSLPLIAERSRRSVSDVQEDYRLLSSAQTIPDLLQIARIHYRAPADATRTGLPHRSIDVVYSNSVLEHVPADVILGIMQESCRVLKSGGLSIHSVNCGDHYAYFDSTITPINYLQFSERAWCKWNNSILYQNRLRPSDFLQQAEKAGLRIVLKKYRPRQELLSALGKLRISPEFSHYPMEELAAICIDFAGLPS